MFKGLLILFSVLLIIAATAWLISVDTFTLRSIGLYTVALLISGVLVGLAFNNPEQP